MMNIKITLSAIFTLCCAAIVNADAYKGEVKSFLELEKVVNEINMSTSTLIVMDDDDTLSMMECDKSKGDEFCQYIGGPAWYAWQDKLLQDYLEHDKDSEYRVANTEKELLDIAALLLAMNNMPYTDKNIPAVLSRLSSKGVRLMVETARGNSNVESTISQFENLSTPKGNFMSLIQDNSLLFGPNNSPSLASPFLACNIPGSRAITYQQGVMYLSGQNKGIMLKCMMTQYENDSVSTGEGFLVSDIVFIDDTLENVLDVYEAFKNDKKYRVHALHYSAFDKHKAELTKGPKKEIYQKNANDRWINIKNAMRSNFLQPNLGGE